jgi:hypothetical protein
VNVTRASLQRLLGSNVVELRFVRRHKKPYWGDVRGLIGTTSPKILTSELGTKVLNFVPPKGIGMAYNYKKRNLAMTWDIFRQEYRVFPVETTVLVNYYPVKTDEQIDQFWKFFAESISKMSQNEKLLYMGYTGK